MYRPEDLNVPLEISPLGTTGYHKIDKFSFEAGADAMYKALWKMAEESPTKTFTLDANVVNCPSVFIPGESI